MIRQRFRNQMCIRTEFVQVEVVAVVQSRRFTVNVVPIVANLILLIECRVIRAKEPEVLNLKMITCFVRE